MTHALEGVDDLEFYRVVFTTTDFGEEEFVHWEIRIREIKFNLVRRALASLCDYSRQ